MRALIYRLLVVTLMLSLTTTVSAISEQDRETAKTIANNMKNSSRLKDYRVGVKYHDGVAWLTGTVTSDVQKSNAELIARRSAGVERVISKLKIATSQELTEPSRSSLQAASNPNKGGEAISDSNIRQTASRDILPDRMQPIAADRRSMPPIQRNIRRNVRNNSPRPYARMAQVPRGAQQVPRGAQQVPRGAQQARSQRGVQPVSYGGPAMNGGNPMAAGGGRPASYDTPQMPGYAWPSYAANPNYAALTYPKQYSASAWPYIGPFYPYPQVPLGWRKVTLEWDDGWWFLDFKDSKGGR
ncbi:MAG: BON domain-containing protein [Pirellulales bacterium]